jgi:hypothetical protein
MHAAATSGRAEHRFRANRTNPARERDAQLRRMMTETASEAMIGASPAMK